MWFVYIVKTINDKLYTGITTDFERRLFEHKNLKVGAKFFRGNPAKEMVHLEFFDDRSSASKREYEIKKYSRKQKEELCGLRQHSTLLD